MATATKTAARKTAATAPPPAPPASEPAAGAGAAPGQSDLEFVLATFKLDPDQFIKDDGTLDRAALTETMATRGQMIARRLM